MLNIYKYAEKDNFKCHNASERGKKRPTDIYQQACTSSAACVQIDGSYLLLQGLKWRITRNVPFSLGYRHSLPTSFVILLLFYNSNMSGG